ncbi:MAG: dTDP-glucose 4,6-dehydratase [Caldiserica bacterium]|nr:MAG: dTDP-glucose 4,6-dehydratase [Caldisericota bacterium]
MRILITGGCGFIGSNFIRYYLKKNKKDYIINLDKLTYAGRKENLIDLEKNPRYEFIKGDIANKKDVEKVMKKGIDAIINFAAETHVDRSIVKPDDFIKTNVYGTYILLEAAKKYGIKRFLQISTDEVYGSIKRGKFKETSPLFPSSPYSASKAGADHLVLSYYKTYKLPVLITRSSNNYGPYQFPEKVIPVFIINALKNKPLPLYGKGENKRDWIYVIDNCIAIEKVFKKGKIGEIYNIASGYEIRNIDLAKKILDILGKSYTLIKSVPDRPGHDYRYALDTSKISKIWKGPKISFEKGLKKTVKWYIKNKWWWEGVCKN